MRPNYKKKAAKYSDYRKAFSKGLVAILCPVLFTSLTAHGGDILRGSATSSSQSGGSGAANASAAAQAAIISPRAKDILSRTTQALQSVETMQSAARSAALAAASSVPNGLNTGGLVPDSGIASSGIANAVTTWQNANTPTQSTAGANTTVNIQQTAQQALLNWKTFNVGKQTTVNFDQSAGGASVSQWIAFNKINDPAGVPSQILGSIKAQGQVYLINQNGIIFGGSSQVNTHTFVASSLPINDNLVSSGLLNNPDLQFLFSSLPISAGKNGTPAFTPTAPATSNGRDGDVVVQAGATITSPTTADHVGGRVALIGPNVTNNGTINTPDGQTILAAGNQVAQTAHSSSDPSLRGLDVFVGSVNQYSGTATNTGLINAPRADVTIAGKNVNQNGAIESSTSVSLNGRIDLLADYKRKYFSRPAENRACHFGKRKHVSNFT
jgi:filamentous hemagglutinin